MKKLLVLLAVFTLAGCAIQQMNTKMDRSNELMEENIQTMESSKATIEENTREVRQSTQTMQMVAFISPALLFIALVAAGYVYRKKFT
jgi:uncharacterized lipoprotein YajG